MPSVVQVEPLTTARALRGPFDYLRPEGARVGSVLEVPFAGRDVLAVVTGLADHSEHEVRAAHRVLDEDLPPALVALGLWVAQEYCSTPARALGLLLPPRGAKAKERLWAQAARPPQEDERLTERQRALLASLPREAGADLGALRRLEARGLAAIGPRRVRRAVDHVAVGTRRPPPALTPEQARALVRIAAGEPGEKLLLHGVTGSGKTEVYLRAAADELDEGRSVLVLVPEIALTPQIVSRFVERFGDTVAVLHSGLSAGERFDEWSRLRSGEARVCVGPRSAVFAPLQDLGLVVVDEEHDASYKHEGDPRYDARLVAERRAELEGALLVAGSATPRCEAVHRLERIRLHERADGAPLPPVQVLDLTEASGAVHPRTHEALVDSRKAIVLLNRRGWSNFLTCRTCGHAWGCPHCDVTLVLHRADGVLACHHCGHRERVPARCPACAGVSIARHGTGTERLADELAAIAPVLRLDAGAGEPGAVLAAFQAADRAILVGTQVVAKGHDFPDVDLGVVLDADATLRFPDFRAEERTFALVAQLAGRAGRGGAQGRVLVQTFAPQASSIAHAARHDSDGFVREELGRRRALQYPPFATLVRVVCTSAAPGLAHAAAAAVKEALGTGAWSALGPAPLFRLRDRERSQLVVKAVDRAPAVLAVGDAVARVAKGRRHKGATFSVDVDPQ